MRRDTKSAENQKVCIYYNLPIIVFWCTRDLQWIQRPRTMMTLGSVKFISKTYLCQFKQFQSYFGPFLL